MNGVTSAIVIGTLLSAVATFYAIKKISKIRWRLKENSTADLSGRAAWIIGLIAFPFAWFLGFIVGGNFGGGFASQISERQGISEEILVSIGIGIGIFICVTLLSAGASLIAFALVRAMTRR